MVASKLQLGLVLLLAAGSAPAAAAGRASPPKILNGTEILTEDDYPKAALRKEEQGTVVIALDVDATGTPRGCAVTRSSGSASLDQGTCQLFKERARFSPARDRRGRAVAGTWHGKPVTWRISAADPAGDAATGTWLQCLYDAARPLFAGPLTREEVADKAYAACAAEEEGMRRLLKDPGTMSFDPNDARREFRPILLKMIDDGRGGVRL